MTRRTTPPPLPTQYARPQAPRFATREEHDNYYRQKHFETSLERLSRKKGGQRQQQMQQAQQADDDLSIEIPKGMIPIVLGCISFYNGASQLLRFLWHAMAFLLFAILLAIAVGAASA